jgi:cullin 1
VSPFFARDADIHLPDFKLKKLCVPLNQLIKVESSELFEMVEEDRRYVIQATIIRIMKERKQINIQPEVVSHNSKL